jgi:hypothetical protein
MEHKVQLVLKERVVQMVLKDHRDLKVHKVAHRVLSRLF